MSAANAHGAMPCLPAVSPSAARHFRSRTSTSPRSARPVRWPSNSRASPGCATSPPPPRADKAAAGLDRVTAWCGVVAAGLLIQGGVPRVARGEAGLARALASAQFDDGGLISRSPCEQVQLVDRFGLLHACYMAAKETMPE